MVTQGRGGKRARRQDTLEATFSQVSNSQSKEEHSSDAAVFSDFGERNSKSNMQVKDLNDLMAKAMAGEEEHSVIKSQDSQTVE